MAEIFDNYPETLSNTLEFADKAQSQLTPNEKFAKNLKKVMKQLRKQNKLLKQFRKHRAMEELPREETPIEKLGNGSKTSVREENSFLSKLGDVFLKALPGILTTAVTAIITALFGRGFKRIRSPMGALA